MSNFLQSFKRKSQNRKLKIAVVGLGYVGLPLAVEFAKKGFSVLGVEVDKDRLAHIQKKESYINDISTRKLAKVINAGNFSAIGDFKELADIDVILICVPTPLKRKYHPDISFICQAVKGISRNIKKGALVILESTTFPGTTEEVILPLFNQANYQHNKDFYLCFSPERIDPGNKDYPLNKIPKVIGGVNKEAAQMAAIVYKNIVNKIVPVSSARVAEAVKLLENTFRLINIGLIDELAMMANKMNIDIWEVIDAAKTKPFGFMPFYPGPGVGGHCIPKDPLYLFWKAKHFGFHSRFIKLASDVISSMPEYIVSRLEHALEAKGIVFKKTRILVIGVTYKKDIKDLRKSPSLDVIEILQQNKIAVSYHDPIIPFLKIGDIDLKSVNLNKNSLNAFDCAVITTDHSVLDYGFILKNSKMIFDTRNVYRNVADAKIIKL